MPRLGSRDHRRGTAADRSELRMGGRHRAASPSPRPQPGPVQRVVRETRAIARLRAACYVRRAACDVLACTSHIILDVTPPKRPSESATEMVQVVLPNDANLLGFILGGTVMH